MRDNEPDKRSEFGGGPGMQGKKATDRLRNTYTSGDPDKATPDDGSAFNGLLPRKKGNRT